MGNHFVVQNCPQCGAPTRLDMKKCEYCEVEFLITSLSYLDRFDKTGITKYINHFKTQLNKDPENGELHQAMGICYLDLGSYDYAIKFFSKSVELMPECADAYYYYALALLKGKRPGLLTLTEIKNIEGLLNTAIQMNRDRSIYYYCWALIKYDFYLKNGLKVKPPTIEELIREARSKTYEKDEVKKMLQRIPIPDKEILNIIYQQG